MMMRRLCHLVALGALMIAGNAGAQSASGVGVGVKTVEPVKAKLELKSGGKKEMEFIGRDLRGWVIMREVGKTMEIGMPATEFKSIEMPVKLDKAALNAACEKRDYKTAAEMLEAALKPAYPFMDLPSNLTPLLSQFLRCLYWDEQYAAIPPVVKLMSRSKDKDVQTEMTLFTCLAQLGMGNITDADVQLTKLGVMEETNSLAPFYWYARVQVLTEQKLWMPAHETAAKIIAYRARDLEWFPVGLYLTVRCYAQAEKYDVADQIVDELKTVCAKSRWTELALRLQEKFPKDRKPPEAPETTGVAYQPKAKQKESKP